MWVEGQLTQLNLRPAPTAFMVLRDPAADMSLSVICPRDLVRNAPVKLAEGTQVIMCGKPNFYTGRGTFSLRVSEIRAVGIGELLARIERLRRLLDAEGLFDPRLKRPIPFLPNIIGLITGRASAAERDVMIVAEARWPAVRFAVRNTACRAPTPCRRSSRRCASSTPIPRSTSSCWPAAAAASRTCCRSPTRRCAGRSPSAPRRWSAPSATNPTTRCAIWSPTCGPPPRPTRPSAIVPDAAAEQALVDRPAQRSARALRNWVHREQHT